MLQKIWLPEYLYLPTNLYYLHRYLRTGATPFHPRINPQPLLWIYNVYSQLRLDEFKNLKWKIFRFIHLSVFEMISLVGVVFRCIISPCGMGDYTSARGQLGPVDSSARGTTRPTDIAARELLWILTSPVRKFVNCLQKLFLFNC
jgi:hypothetical protein